MPPGNEDLTRLLQDPHTVLTPKADVKALDTEVQTLAQAVEAAASRTRDEVSLERARAMPAKVAAARELMTLLECFGELLTADMALCSRLNAAGYAWQGVLPPLAYPHDRAALEQLVLRLRASRLLEH